MFRSTSCSLGGGPAPQFGLWGRVERGQVHNHPRSWKRWYDDDDGDDDDDDDDDDDGDHDGHGGDDDAHGGDYDGNDITVNLRQYLCWCLQLIKLR